MADAAADRSRRCWVVWNGFFVALAFACVVTARSTLSFPYIRTLISCDEPTPEDFPRDSEDWSGSRRCAVVDKVVEDATLLRGVASGFDMGLQCVSLPVLGHLADSFGRRVIVFWCMGCLLVASLAFFGSARLENAAMYIFGFVVQGLSGAMSALASALVADTCEDKAERGAFFGFFQALGVLLVIVVAALVNTFAIAVNEYDYEPVAFLLLAATVLVAVLAWMIWPETLPRRLRTPFHWAVLNPFAGLSVLRKDPFLLPLSGMVFLIALGSASTSVLQGFTVKVYGWSNEDSTWIVIAVGLLIAVAMASTACLVPRFGAAGALRGGIAIGAAGMVVVGFAGIGPAVGIVGVLVLALGGGIAIPSWLTLVTGRVETSDQGRLATGMTSIALAGSAIGQVLYPAIFLGTNDIGRIGAGIAFFVGALIMVAAVVVLHYTLRAFPDADDGTWSKRPAGAAGAGGAAGSTVVAAAPGAATASSGRGGDGGVGVELAERGAGKEREKGKGKGRASGVHEDPMLRRASADALLLAEEVHDMTPLSSDLAGTAIGNLAAAGFPLADGGLVVGYEALGGSAVRGRTSMGAVPEENEGEDEGEEGEDDNLDDVMRAVDARAAGGAARRAGGRGRRVEAAGEDEDGGDLGDGRGV